MVTSHIALIRPLTHQGCTRLVQHGLQGCFNLVTTLFLKLSQSGSSTPYMAYVGGLCFFKECREQLYIMQFL